MKLFNFAIGNVYNDKGRYLKEIKYKHEMVGEVLGDKSGKVLDLGFNQAPNTFFKGFVYGVDKEISGKPSNYVEVVKADLDCCDSLPYSDKSFCTILAYDILEHLECMPKVLNELHRILADDGILAVTVPNYGGINMTVIKFFNKDHSEHHIYDFDREFVEAGFVITEKFFFRFKMPFIYFVIINKRVPKLLSTGVAYILKKRGLKR